MSKITVFSRKKILLKRLLPLIFYIFVLTFLVLYIKNIDFRQIQNAHFSGSFLVIASLFGLAARYWAVLVWFVLLNSLGAKGLRGHKHELIYVFAKSWMGRYIPGTAPWILGKIYFASQLGISKNKLAVSSMLEGSLQVTVTMALAIILLLSDYRLQTIDRGFKIILTITVLACLVSLLPPVFNRIITFGYRLIKRKKLDKEHLASMGTIVRGAVLFLVSAFLTGISLFFIAKSIYPDLGYNDALFVMGASSLAGAIGTLAIFVPGGIGVREGVLVLLLRNIMPAEIALVVAITGRLWSVIIDLLFLGLSKIAVVLSASSHSE